MQERTNSTQRRQSETSKKQSQRSNSPCRRTTQPRLTGSPRRSTKPPTTARPNSGGSSYSRTQEGQRTARQFRLTDTDKLTPDTVNNALAAAVKGALEREGIVVLASCGYYYENMHVVTAAGPGGEQVEFHKYTPRVPAKNPADAEYQKQWIERLRRFASAFGHAVFADATRSWQSTNPADAGSKRRLDSTRPQPPKPGTASTDMIWPPNVRRIGVSPRGKRLN